MANAIFIEKKELPFGIAGIALFLFVFYKKDLYTNELRQHELIHIRQQIEMLILPFFVWYLLEWCIRRIKAKSWHEAYFNISFEREAYRNDFKKD